MKHIHGIIIALLLVLAAIFRFTGINWDDNAHLHPDERFLTMVATNISWPTSIGQYFDTQSSPLNPHNNGFSFYVYGTYPLHLAKAAAQLVHKDTYDGITLTGRVLSGIVDLITLIVVYLLARALTKNNRRKESADAAGFVAAFAYAIAVLPIQLSHFFTADPYVTLFSAIVLLRMIRGKPGFITGMVAACAAGAKISGALILIPFVLWYITAWIGGNKKTRPYLIRSVLLFAAGFLITLRVVYPYLFDGFRLNPAVLGNWRQLKSFDSPTTSFPPGIQWTGVSGWQPASDAIVWGLGLPLGLIAAGSMIYILFRIFSAARNQKLSWFSQNAGLLAVVGWIILLFVFEGFQFPKPMRYLWPAYPALAVTVGVVWHTLFAGRRTPGKGVIWYVALSLILILWPLAYIPVYTTPNTRVRATDWIYARIPEQSVIAWESWDDPLPFSRGTNTPGRYETPALPVFDPDSPAKWQKIADILTRADYLILSSNRGYGAMGRARARFPETYRYYQLLADGSLGFTPVAVFTSRPVLPVPGISVCISVPGFSYGSLAGSLLPCSGDGLMIMYDSADETFTVYDHPSVIIFRKTADIPYGELLGI